MPMEFYKPYIRLWKYFKIQKNEIIYIYLYSISNGIISLTLPLGIQSIVSFLFAQEISTSLVVLIITILFGVLLSGYLQVLQMRVIERMQQQVFTYFSLTYAYILPRVNIAYLDKYYLPELVNRFFDTGNIQKGISKLFLDLPVALITVIFGLVVLSFYHPYFIFLGLMLVFIVGIILFLTINAGIKTSIIESDYKYKVVHWLEELSRNIITIKMSGKYDFAINKADQLTSGYIKSRKHHFDILQIQYFSFIAFKFIITAMLLIIGCFLFIDRKITIGQFVASELIILNIIVSIEKIIGSMETIYDTITAFEKLAKLTDIPIEHSPKNSVIVNNIADLSLHNLSFYYSKGQDYALQNISFQLKHGQKIALVGNEKSGKSTLFKLLSAQFDIYEGNILINHIPLNQIDKISYRKKVGKFTSNISVFEGTLYENLFYDETNPDWEYFEYIAQKTKLNNYIKNTPEGLQKFIDPLGLKLADSIVAKIVLTRILLKKPDLMLIDDFRDIFDKDDRTAIIDFLLKEYTGTVLYATKDEVFANQFGQILYLLDEGVLLDKNNIHHGNK